MTLAEVAAESGWSLEGAIQQLRIEVVEDWAGRPCVNVADAGRLMLASRTAGNEWYVAQAQRFDRENLALRTPTPRKRPAPVSRVIPGGISSIEPFGD